jgi:hypothetical protein
MSSQPGDPRPQDPAPVDLTERDGEAPPPRPGFWRQTATLFANRNAKVLLAIVLVLLLILGIAMVTSLSQTSEGPGPGGALPGVHALVALVGSGPGSR